MASGVSIKDLPAGARMDDGIIRATFEGCVPIAGASVRKGLEMTLNARFTLNASTIDIVGRQKSSETWKEVRK